MLGDFNEVLSGDEKFGGNSINLNRALEFKECLDDYNMLDLGFTGPKYTWTNSRPITDLILERIDRCLANPSWRTLYSDATVTHLPRIWSDHFPVLLELSGSHACHLIKPFRFHTMWLLHPEFHHVVQQAWPENRNLHNAISDFVNGAKKWNSEVFGNLFTRKRRVLARLSGAQKALAENPNEFLIGLEKKLIEEYSLIMLQEEEYWALKSRLNAANFGDRNTSFFHVTTMVRRHRNKIRSTKDNVGNWILDDLEINNHIRAGFQKLYATESLSSPINSGVSEFSCCYLSEEDSTKIETEVSVEEIRNGLWSLKAFKAPGLDGLHAGFFQHFWTDVENSVCKEIKEAFFKGSIPRYLNETFVTLIPKCQNPETLNNYRPISLCNSVYKIISKIIVARIRPALGKLISPVQSAFVPGRRGMDNVLIAQELLYSLDRKKGKMGYMAVKLDLEKAYDRLEWNFIHKVLTAFHFPLKLIRMIMSCISTTNISILVNGGMLEPFEPSRGIRQGDLLSPYIFILCMEYLSHLIEQKCVEGTWVPLKASKNNLGISHLLSRTISSYLVKWGMMLVVLSRVS